MSIETQNLNVKLLYATNSRFKQLYDDMANHPYKELRSTFLIAIDIAVTEAHNLGYLHGKEATQDAVREALGLDT